MSESLFDAWRSIDREKTQMQECGFVGATGLTLAQVIEIVTDLGIKPTEVGFASQHLVLLEVPHVFRGRHDRWCEVCNRPDRHSIHVLPEMPPRPAAFPAPSSSPPVTPK